LQTAVHKLTLTSNWLILGSSSSFSSKTDMGARKIIALTSMKYGCHTPLFRRLSVEGTNTYICDCSRAIVTLQRRKKPIRGLHLHLSTVNHTPISLKRIKRDTHLCPTRTDTPEHPPSVTAHERCPHLLARNLDVRCDRGHPRSYVERRRKSSGRESREKARTLRTLTIRTDPPAANRALLKRRERRRLPTARQCHRETSG
jgi:hypothetical protein